MSELYVLEEITVRRLAEDGVFAMLLGGLGAFCVAWWFMPWVMRKRGGRLRPTIQNRIGFAVWLVCTAAAWVLQGADVSQIGIRGDAVELHRPKIGRTSRYLNGEIVEIRLQVDSTTHERDVPTSRLGDEAFWKIVVVTGPNQHWRTVIAPESVLRPLARRLVQSTGRPGIEARYYSRSRRSRRRTSLESERPLEPAKK